MYTVTEWGVSNEPADIFERRNMKSAKPKYPQNFTTAQEVRFSDMPFLPIVGFENADWDKMYHEAKSLEKKLENLKKEQQKLNGMLGNEKFVSQAPADVIEKNKARLEEVN